MKKKKSDFRPNSLWTLPSAGLLLFLTVIPLIMLPLWLTGVDKIICHESPAMFIVAVFVSLVSNFYFFYMNIII